jgi:hypothetical protein
MSINLITASSILGKTIVGNFTIAGIYGDNTQTTVKITNLPYYREVITGQSVNTTLKINTFSVFSRPAAGDNQSRVDLAVQCMFNDIPLQWNDIYDSSYIPNAYGGYLSNNTEPADKVQRVISLTKANFVNKNEPLYLNQFDRLGLQVLGNTGYQSMYFSYVVSYEEVSLTV